MRIPPWRPPFPRPTVAGLRPGVEAADASWQAADAAASEAAAAEVAARAALEAARRSGDAAAIDAAVKALAGAVEAAARADAQRAAAEGALARARAGLLALLAPYVDPTALDGSRPVALLPVRIETRFMPGPELWVRLFPDDVHADTHEPGLTAAEREWGEHFWREGWEAAAEADAWRQLAARFGPRRAAWIANVLTPVNVARRGLPGETPAFAATAARPAAWSRAARTATLPDRWVVLGYWGGQRTLRAAGSVIPDPLPTGPSPTAAAAASTADLPVDDGVRWRVDFDVAVAAGMALKIPLTAQQARDGFDRLLVVGVKPTLTAATGAARVRLALIAHHHTAGLSLPAAGTPTNTSDDGRSPATSAAGDDQDAGYAIERGTPAPAPGTDGDALATALGVAPTTLAGVRGAADTGLRRARLMDTVLWPATWGYYLAQLMAGRVAGAPPLISPGTRSAVRRFALAHVRGRGPLPLLRVGSQPYGVLPASALATWRTMGEDPVVDQIVSLVRGLGPVWRTASGAVPRARPGADPDATLLGLLRLDANVRTLRGRATTSREYERNLAALLGEAVAPVSARWDAIEQATLQRLAAIGIVGAPRLVDLAAGDGAAPRLDGPLVEDSRILSPGPARVYLHELAVAPPALTWSRPSDLGLAPVLYLLARHSVLRAWLDAADELRGVPADDAREQILLGFTAGGPVDPYVRLLGGPMPTAADAIEAARGQPNPPPLAAELEELRAALVELAGVSAAELAQLLREGLGLSAHRLDAWATAVASARLALLRGGPAPDGVHVGGWGWLEEVRPGHGRVEIEPPDGETRPVWSDPQGAGYVHAPSLGHAATAAVLRSGWLTHSGTSGAALAVDLSSERVRRAVELVDGVRAGQPPSALLGYRFERDLHERRGMLELDRYIAPLRAAFPLVAGKRAPKTAAVESTAAANVVDGLALLRGRGTLAWGAGDLPAEGTPEQAGLEAALDDLADTADAVNDLLVAESVHQAVQGNLGRAAGALEALSRGEQPPPGFDVITTPRSGRALTHRLAVLFSGGPGAGGSWTAPQKAGPDTVGGLRAALEPHGEAWAAALLPDPADVRFGATVADRAGGAQLFAGEMRLDAVGLSALDVVASAVPGDAPEATSLERLIAYRVARLAPNVPGDADVEVTLSFEKTWSGDDPTVPELMAAAATVRDLLARSRPALPRDVAVPGAGDAAFDEAELEARVAAAAGALTAAETGLRAKPTVGTTDGLRAALLQAVAFGIPGAVPERPLGQDKAVVLALAAQASSVRAEVRRRLDDYAAATAAGSGLAEPEARLRAAGERLRALFGAAPLALPAFGAPDAAELAAALAAGTTIQDGDPLAADALLVDAAAVREGAARLADTLLVRAAFDPVGSLANDLTVAQLPHDPAGRWVGLELQDDAMAANRLSLLVHAAAKLDAAQPLRGVVVDEWTETVPSTEETTGVTFHYDAPAAEAPQAIVLAVPAAAQSTWTLDALEAILLETADRAVLRGVDLDALGDAGHLLPAAWLAYDPIDRTTVSTDLRHAVSGLWPPVPAP